MSQILLYHAVGVREGYGYRKKGSGMGQASIPPLVLSRQEAYGEEVVFRSSFLSRTTRIKRRLAQDVADTTDSLRAVACIRFIRLLSCRSAHAMFTAFVSKITLSCPDRFGWRNQAFSQRLSSGDHRNPKQDQYSETPVTTILCFLTQHQALLR